ncbi:MAG: YraN family protein [Patescibacteria group bacterium]
MKQFNSSIGRQGEDIATSYLIDKGYVIIERNFKVNLGEIDIIAKHRGFLVFVEVKYRTSLYYGEPYEAVNIRKLSKLRRLVDYYYLLNKPTSSPKIEILSILKTDEKYCIRHIQTIIF